MSVALPPEPVDVLADLVFPQISVQNPPLSVHSPGEADVGTVIVAVYVPFFSSPDVLCQRGCGSGRALEPDLIIEANGNGLVTPDASTTVNDNVTV